MKMKEYGKGKRKNSSIYMPVKSIEEWLTFQ